MKFYRAGAIKDPNFHRVDAMKIQEPLLEMIDDGCSAAVSASMMVYVQTSFMRELRTALAAFDIAEYTGGRERAAQYLASVVRDGLVNFRG